MKLVEYSIYELLSGLLNGDVYAQRAPQNKTEFIVFSRVSSQRWRCINSPSGMAQATIQIDCYSKGYYTSKAIGADVENILDGYRGVVVHNAESIRVAGISLQDDIDLQDQTQEPFLYRNMLTFLVTYEQ